MDFDSLKKRSNEVMIYFKSGSENTVLDSKDLEAGIVSSLKKIGTRRKVLVVPPDCTRFHSRAGELTSYIYKYYKNNLKDILPALRTHSPATDLPQIGRASGR